MTTKHLVRALPLLVLLGLAACSRTPDPAPQDATAAAAPAAPREAARPAPAVLPKGEPGTPLEAYRKVDSGHQVMFIYYALSKLPTPYEEIAETYSRDYGQTSDSFRRRDILTSLQPRIDQEIASARDQRYIVTQLQEPGLLLRYDFDKKAFPVKDFSDDRFTYFYDNGKYTLGTTNAGSFAAFKVEDEARAREIEGYLSANKALRLETYAFAQDADPSNRRVKLQVMKMRLFGPDGGLLAEM